MDQNRKAFIVYVDLDPVPGEFHSQESALHSLRNVLRNTIGHYNPMVSLAPETLQPETVDNVEAVVEDGKIVLKESVREIPIFVPRSYQMDPEVDDLLPTGNDLIEGMRVLIEDNERRINIDHSLFVPGTLIWAQAMKFNRWCTVSDLYTDGECIYFIANYDDRTKSKMNIGINDAWYVKIDSRHDAIRRQVDDIQDSYRKLITLKTMTDPVEIEDELFSRNFDEISPMEKKVDANSRRLKNIKPPLTKMEIQEIRENWKKIHPEVDSREVYGKVPPETSPGLNDTFTKYLRGELNKIQDDEWTTSAEAKTSILQTPNMFPSPRETEEAVTNLMPELGQIIEKDRADNPVVEIRAPFMGEFEGHDI